MWSSKGWSKENWDSKRKRKKKQKITETEKRKKEAEEEKAEKEKEDKNKESSRGVGNMEWERWSSKIRRRSEKVSSRKIP